MTDVNNIRLPYKHNLVDDDEVLLYVHINRRLIRDGEPRTATSTFTQLLTQLLTSDNLVRNGLTLKALCRISKRRELISAQKTSVDASTKHNIYTDKCVVFHRPTAPVPSSLFFFLFFFFFSFFPFFFFSFFFLLFSFLFNSFCAPACETSGLESCTEAPANSIFSNPITIYFQCYAFG